jgi:hypothetical protein
MDEISHFFDKIWHMNYYIEKQINNNINESLKRELYNKLTVDFDSLYDELIINIEDI